jgi:UDP-glucose:glycoprotein glucosyltransferase
LGNNSHPQPAILYADITSPSFARFHQTLSKTAKEDSSSYRVRHKPSLHTQKSPLVVNGYGVELQLKRTDYIVIDDRPSEQGEKAAAQKPLNAELQDDEEVNDLKPLSKDDVADLGLKAASFVMKSEQPMETLMKLIQDFPKYSSTIVAHNATEEFITENERNRNELLPSGYNIIWINGVQIPNRDVNPFALLEHLRRERNLVHGVQSQGLSAADTISLLSHPAITETQSESEPQRYDFRDEMEGGNIIVWMNNIEKDSRYESWPSNLNAVSASTCSNYLLLTSFSYCNGPSPASYLLFDVIFTMLLFLWISLQRRTFPELLKQYPAL